MIRELKKMLYSIQSFRKQMKDQKNNKYEKWFSKQSYNMKRVIIVAKLKGLDVKSYVAYDLADAVHLGGTHICKFFDGKVWFLKCGRGSGVADDADSAAANLIKKHAKELDKPLSQLKLMLAIKSGE